MPEIKININTQAIMDLFEEIEKRLENTGPLMKNISETLLHAVQQNFIDQGRDESGGTGIWPDLSDTRKAQREKMNSWPGQILRVDNILYESIQETSTDDTALVHTNMVYATTMHYGAKKGEFGGAKVDSAGRKHFKGKFVSNDASTRPIPWGDIPARPFMMITDQDKEDITDILKNHLNGA